MRKSAHVLPFWISSSRRDKELGTTSSFRKLFPLFKHRREDQWRRTSFPTLDPLWRNSFIDRYYSWIWKLFEWEDEGRHVPLTLVARDLPPRARAGRGPQVPHGALVEPQVPGR